MTLREKQNRGDGKQIDGFGGKEGCIGETWDFFRMVRLFCVILSW